MQFSSFEFLIFFFALLTLMLIIKNATARKIILVVFNIVFYFIGGGLYQSIFLLVYVSLVFLMGFFISKRRKKPLLIVLIIFSILPMLLYKYLPGFLGIDSYKSFITVIGIPLGLSFICLNSISYLTQLYKGKTVFCINPINLFLYLSFFAYISAGPFEDPNKMFSEFNRGYRFDYNQTVSGLIMMGLGLFLKVFVAETLFYIINIYYLDPQNASSLMLLVSTLFFSFAIYADFYGYSIIAKGVARVLGIEISDNFRQPYLSSSISSFWRKWHMSFQNWLRENVYFPLGGSKKTLLRTLFNIMIVFVVSGIWHGVGFTFIIWGALNGVYIALEKLLKIDKKEYRGFPKVLGFVVTFILITISWIFFRASSIDDAFVIFYKIFVILPVDLLRVLNGSQSIMAILPSSMTVLLRLCFGVVGIIAVTLLDIYERKNGRIYDCCRNWNAFARWSFYVAILTIPVIIGVWGYVSEFMYAQF